MAGISISSIVGDNGIIDKAKKARNETNKSEAQEKLEMELINLGIDKDIVPNYNENEYINNKLINKGMLVSDNLVSVDGWLFEIDRSVPEIKNTLGEVNGEITINLKQSLSTDNLKSTIIGTIFSKENIKNVNLDGKYIEYREVGNGEFKIEVQVTENGSYGIFVQDEKGKYQMANIIIEGILGDIEIHNLEELNDFKDKVKSGTSFEGKKVSLMEDIDLGLTTSSSWTPIDGFKGTFDGNEHKISNLYINSSKENQGFFGTIDSKATVKGLVIESGEIRGSSKYVGAVTGKNSGTIEACESKISVTGSTYVGGIARIFNRGNKWM